MRPIVLAAGLGLCVCAARGQGLPDQDWYGVPAKADAARALAAACGPVGELLPGGLPRAFPPGNAYDDFTDVLHYQLDLEIIPATTTLAGSNTITVRSLVPDLTLFHFRLHENFTITMLSRDATPLAWQRLDSATVAVTLDRPYGVDEVFDITIAYTGHPPSGQGLGAITFRTRGGSPDIYTLSEPFFAHTWWPVKDALTDKTTADLWYTVPDTLVVASNGLLQGTDVLAPGKLRYRWKTEYPTADYLYCFGATNYDTFESTWTRDGVTLPLKFFIYPEDNTPSHRSAWRACENMLTTFSDLYGTYPFMNEKYGMLEFGWGGGMEHQTITSIGGFGEWLVAHELSHQWWGDHVTCATWHDIWLNEGFATYSEALWFEHRPGSPGEPWLHAVMSVRRPAETAYGTVYCYDASDPARILDMNLSYYKAAWVLHMLRHRIGDDAFFDVLAAWRAAYGGGSGTTEDFRAVVEGVTGDDLANFFQRWVYEAPLPFYTFGWQPIVVDGAGYIELYIEQIQGTSESVFDMPIDLVVTDAEGDAAYTVWNDARVEYLLFPVRSTTSDYLRFDPTPWILADQQELVFPDGAPPKIVTLQPAPGAVVQAADLPELEAVFHVPVTAAAADFTLVGARTGNVTCAFAYDAVRQAVTLTPASDLLPDEYTLTIADTVVSMAGVALDGELSKPRAMGPLPSGDGLAGGAAVATFAVYVPGDLNCDGIVNFGDVNAFVLALSNPGVWAETYPHCPARSGDVDGDGAVNFGDINPFVSLIVNP
ncbi:MAG TPA: M1 family aminopeptidase [Phycisphaerae bacterium]|nr:M1 family aminopeptidase [Phycisphaerae bacterium]